MTHDQSMMVFAINCNIEDGRAEVAGKLAASLTHQLSSEESDSVQATAYGRAVPRGFSYLSRVWVHIMQSQVAQGKSAQDPSYIAALCIIDKAQSSMWR